MNPPAQFGNEAITSLNRTRPPWPLKIISARESKKMEAKVRMAQKLPKKSRKAAKANKLKFAKQR